VGLEMGIPDLQVKILSTHQKCFVAYLGDALPECLRHGKRSPSTIFRFFEVKLIDQAKRTVCLLMEAVKPPVEGNVAIKKQACSQSKSNAQNVQYSIELVFGNIPPSDFEVVLDHFPLVASTKY